MVLVSPAVPAQELNADAARARAGHVVKATSKASADSPIARRRWQAEIEVAVGPAAHAGKTYWLTGPGAGLQL